MIIFESILTTFKLSVIFRGSLGSSVDWLETKFLVYYSIKTLYLFWSAEPLFSAFRELLFVTICPSYVTEFETPGLNGQCLLKTMNEAWRKLNEIEQQKCQINVLIQITLALRIMIGICGTSFGKTIFSNPQNYFLTLSDKVNLDKVINVDQMSPSTTSFLRRFKENRLKDKEIFQQHFFQESNFDKFLK